MQSLIRKTMTRSLLGLILILLLPLAAGAAGNRPETGPLRILLTNDDGFDSDGIEALHVALKAAGHDVTIVAPATQQSGKGGSINTGVFDFTPGGGTMRLTFHGDGVWSLAGSPSDCVTTALDVVMKDNPPDLIVSGLNEGQNVGRPGSNGSGTVGAALKGLFRGIPSIAGSMELDFSESRAGFPSTVASYGPAAEFIARLIGRLQATSGRDLLPPGAMMLNLNFPVPYSVVKGFKVTRLGPGSDIELPHFDPSQGFPSFGIPPIASFPPCASVDEPGEFCFSTVGLGFSPSPDPVKDSEMDALRGDYISITPMSGDMTSGPPTGPLLEKRLRSLQP